jgi:sugar phosphate isomerase/epimerase
MTLNNLSKEYFLHVEVLHSERTFKTNIGYYNKHIKDTIGLKDIKELNYSDIQLFTNALVNQQYKIKTVKNIIRHIASNGYVDICSICCRQVGWNTTDNDGFKRIGTIWKKKTYTPISQKLL